MIGILNAVIAGIGTIILGLISLLPSSPFGVPSGLPVLWLGYINYFIPVGGMVASLTVYLVAVALYYVLRVGMRWAKIAGS